MAAYLREPLHAIAQRGGAMHKGRRAIESIGRETVPPDGGLFHFALGEQAPRECLLDRIVQVGLRVRWPLLWGDIGLRAGLLLLIPSAQLRSGLLEGKADGDGDVRRDHQEEAQALPPDLATPLFIVEFVQRGERLGCLGVRVVAIVDDEAAPGQAILAQDASDTRNQEFVPGNLAISQHPCQGRE